MTYAWTCPAFGLIQYFSLSDLNLSVVVFNKEKGGVLQGHDERLNLSSIWTHPTWAYQALTDCCCCCLLSLLLLLLPFFVVPAVGSCGRRNYKPHLVRTQSLNVLPLKPGVGQYIAILATLTARDLFLAYFYPSGPFTCIFSKPPPIFSCLGCG